jgi:hypothetical protein
MKLLVQLAFISLLSASPLSDTDGKSVDPEVKGSFIFGLMSFILTF